MNTIRISAIILLLLVLSCCSLHAQNLLTNPSFESFPVGTHYGDEVFTDYDWRYFSVSGAGGTFDSVSPGQNGSIAVQLSRTSTLGDTGLDRDGNLIPVTAGQRYRATVMAKSETNSSMRLTLAPYDANMQWLGTQRELTFALNSSFLTCVSDYVVPAGTAYLNFAIRVSGTGAITVDNCSLRLITVAALTAPTITYPVNETVDSFTPTIAFSGSAHSAYQVIVTSGETTVWDSGTVTGTAFSRKCTTTLQPSTNYQAKARMQRDGVWSGYSNTTSFTTPPAPILKITAPTEADSLRGPTTTVKWLAESPTGITSQKIRIDDGTPITISKSSRSYNLSNLSAGLHTVSVTAVSTDGTAVDTTKFNVYLTPAASGTIYYYDASYILSYNRADTTQRKLAYDLAMAISSLQGLVNRGGERLFIKVFSEDSTWWSRMRENGNWLANKTVVTLPTGFSNISTLFSTFASDYQGAVIWDPNVYATANVASTVAGADNLIPIRYDTAPGSLYSTLITNGLQIPVQLDLRDRFTGTDAIWDTSIPSTGSKKCDAYIWARTKYLETGKSNPAHLMYGVDAYWLDKWFEIANPGHTLFSRDYVVQNKGFVFDLCPWGDEKPVDDQNQTLGLDLSTLRSILYAAATRTPGMIHIQGFVPWEMKYTTWHALAGEKHEPVETEWEYAKWISYYNGYMDADCGTWSDLPNCSLYRQFPLPDRLIQNRKLSFTELRKLGYVSRTNQVAPINFLNIYMGDYDSAAWVARMAISKWSDGYRGVWPTSWAFNPNHIKRIPALMEYYYRTRTANDSFIAGDCGAGYVNPSRLLTDRASGLPSARDIWIAHNLRYFRATGIKTSGFLINGTAGPMGSDVDDMYSKFSPEGCFSQGMWYPQQDRLVGTMPALRMQRDLTGNSTTDINIVQPDGLIGSTRFLNYRTILVSPTYLNTLYTGISQRDTTMPWAFVDTPVYTALASCHLGKAPDARATYTFDYIPWRTVDVAQSLNGTIGIRNDGWVDWDSTYSLMLTWKNGTQVVKREFIPLPHPVPSGGGIVMDFVCIAPTQDGNLTFYYEMAKNGTGFSALGDYNWEIPVTVEPSALVNTPANAKAQPDGAQVTIWDAVVTAGNDQFSYAFYIEDEQRVSGIKVSSTGTSISVSEGDRVRLKGTLSGSTLERTLQYPVLLSKESTTPLEPLALKNGSIGGNALNQYTPGVYGMTGLNNIGLLVKIWGRITYVNTTAKYFFVDDGSAPTDPAGNKGVYVRFGKSGTWTLPQVGDYVSITGISFRYNVSGKPHPSVMLRKQADLQIMAE